MRQLVYTKLLLTITLCFTCSDWIHDKLRSYCDENDEWYFLEVDVLYLENLHLVHFISREPYIIWLSFIVHLSKMTISPGFLFPFFLNFDSLGCWRGGECKRAKNGPKWEKFLSVMLHVSGILDHTIFIYGTDV